jgi:hypothetical protein
MVEEKWRMMQLEGSAGERLEYKLCELRIFLKEWRRQSREERNRVKREALDEIARLDNVDDVGLLSEEDRIARARHM